MGRSILGLLRREYHRRICSELLSARRHHKGLNIADSSSKSSMAIAAALARKMACPVGRLDRSAQTLGQLFPQLTMQFLQDAFNHLRHLRPGDWVFSASQAEPGIAAFDQYEHLAVLQKLVDGSPELKATLGMDYLITPDIIVARQPVSDAEINRRDRLVHQREPIARLSPLRMENKPVPCPVLHASISCKWTMRSDRAQNTRTEALNLIRNRKGKTPHIVVVTFEPLPTRLASIAMGTGDLDCTYHVALDELREAARQSGCEDQADLLEELIAGRRIRDISDLPLDLAT